MRVPIDIHISPAAEPLTKVVSSAVAAIAFEQRFEVVNLYTV